MFKKKVYIYTAVTLLFLAFLAACGGGDTSQEAETAVEEPEASEEVIDDLEATGSESAGNDILPTPVTGPKVTPTRSANSLEIDLYFLVQPALGGQIRLEMVPDFLAEQPIPVEAQYSLGFLSEEQANESVAFTSDFGELTAVLAQPAPSSVQNGDMVEMLTGALQQPGWRAGVDRLLFVFVSEPSSLLSDESLAALVETAVANETAIYPFLLEDFSATEQARWQQLAAATNGQLAVVSTLPVNDEGWQPIISEALTHALQNE